MIERHVQAIYCDDIRHEVSGKKSYIGVYSSNMIVESIPVTLAKFCVSITVTTPISEPFEVLKISVTKGDETIHEMEVPAEMLDLARKEAKDESSNREVQVFSSLVGFTPFIINEPCLVRVRAQTESGELRATALDICEGEIPQLG